MLKPPTITQMREPPPKPDDEEGCQFDILHFEHIGKCRGTCDGEGDGIQQFVDTQSGKLVIVLVDLSNATEEDIRDLEKRGLKRLTEEELHDIISECDAGELEVEVKTMTLEELREKYPRRNALPKKDPNPYLSIKDAAQELQFSESWVRKLCAKGRLEGAMKLERRWAIPHDAIYMKED